METEQIMAEINEILETAKKGKMAAGDIHATDDENIPFYINEYELYTEINRHSQMMEEINYNPFVDITLGDGKKSNKYLEIVGKAEQVTDQRVIDWWSEKHNNSLRISELTLLKILVQKVKLIDEGNGKKQTNA